MYTVYQTRFQATVIFFDDLNAYTPDGLSHECFTTTMAAASGPNLNELRGFMNRFIASTRTNTRYLYGIEKAFEMLMPYRDLNTNSKQLLFL